MLVVLSDLHLADGTAGEHNLAPQAYIDFLDQVAEAHARVRQHNPQSRVEFVFAGDIFELLRTHFWFLQAEHKPWRHFQVVEKKAHAKPPQSTEYLDRAVQLFNQIMTHPHVSPIKGILGDRLADRFGGIEPLRLYIPGHSDRMINMHPGLRARVIDFLGLDLGRSGPWNPEYRFPNVWTDEAHGVFIRHGHEGDVYSFEGEKTEAEDYDLIPMSDLITCELFARLTYEASLIQPSEAATAEQLQVFRSKLEQIDNVRPVSSVIQWLTRHFESDTEKKCLQDCIARALTNFEGQDYVKWWLSGSGHDDWYNPMDEADRLELLVGGLKNLKLGKIGAALKIFDKFAAYDPYDRYIKNAAKEEIAKNPESQVRYIVYGHTHFAQHVPLMVHPETGREIHYLNNGSMRPTHMVTRDGRNFVTTESLCFSIFYRADERPGATCPTFEQWNGARSRIS